MADFAYAARTAPVPLDPNWPPPPGDTYTDSPIWPWRNPPRGVGTPYPPSVQGDVDENGETYRFSHIVKSINQRLVATGQSVSTLSTTDGDSKVTVAKINTARNYIEGLYDDFVKSDGTVYETYNDILEDAEAATPGQFGRANAEGGWTWISLDSDGKTVNITADMAADDKLTPHLFYQLESALKQLVYISDSDINTKYYYGYEARVDNANQWTTARTVLNAATVTLDSATNFTGAIYDYFGSQNKTQLGRGGRAIITKNNVTALSVDVSYYSDIGNINYYLMYSTTQPSTYADLLNWTIFDTYTASASSGSPTTATIDLSSLLPISGTVFVGAVGVADYNNTGYPSTSNAGSVFNITDITISPTTSGDLQTYTEDANLAKWVATDAL